MKILATFFNQTKLVEVALYNMVEGEEPEHILWVERPEDEYALMSPQLRNKKVAIVSREEWLNETKVY